AGLLVDADSLRDLLGAPDEVALLEAPGLLAQCRALEGFEVLEELGAAEAPLGFLAGAADGDGELRGDVDPRAVAPGLLGRPVNVLHTAPDLLRGQHGRHPALRVRTRAPPHLGVIAAGVDRQRVLDRFGVTLHVLAA